MYLSPLILCYKSYSFIHYGFSIPPFNIWVVAQLRENIDISILCAIYDTFGDYVAQAEQTHTHTRYCPSPFRHLN